MKAGDTIQVNMEGFHVANAVIEDITDGEAVIFIPATRVVLGVSQSLVEKEPEAQAQILNGPREIPNGIQPQEAPQTPVTASVSPEEARREQLAQAEIAAAYAGTQSLRDMDFDTTKLDSDV